MAERDFTCTAADPFDLFALREATQRELGSRAPAELDVHVRHPDREADGSCRWCGCREDEILVIRA
jgi:hypothetical protein